MVRNVISAAGVVRPGILNAAQDMVGVATERQDPVTVDNR
jgi:hypothetical protein